MCYTIKKRYYILANGGHMNTLPYINDFSITLYKFYNYRVSNNPLIYKRPCIGYILKGEAEFLYNGHSLAAKEGDLIYISTGTQYYSIWKGSPDIYWYSISYNFINFDDKAEYKFQILKNYPPDLFAQIYNKYEAKSMESLGLFYIFLEKMYTNLKKEEYVKEKAAVRPALEYIERNYTEKIPIEFLAQLCNFSQARFFTLFKAATGCTPIEYKNNILIQNGVKLLAESQMSVEEISDTLGFSSVAYFRRVFKNITKKTPKDIRKM